MTALMALVSLAVDLGRVQLVKTELFRATDAAARYGASYASSGLAAVQAAAINAADDNTVDGSILSLSSSDIQIGYWNSSTKTFTNNGTPNNAVKVSTQRTVSLAFARAVGMTSSTVRATSVAYMTTNGVSGYIGLDSIDMKNNTFIASYNSSVTTNPTGSSYSSNGGLASNGAIDPNKNCDLYGTLILGPSGSNAGVTVHPTSAVVVKSTNLTAPTMPTWSPSSNPGGISQTYTVNSNTTLPGGTYWFTSLTVNATLSFSGAATVYVNGNVVVGGDIYAYNLIPSNLVIYQLGSSRTFGDAAANGMDIVAKIIAPTSDFDAKNNLKLRGSAIFKTMGMKNNADLYYDEAIGSVTGATTISTVK